MHAGKPTTPPPVDRMIDMCKNITLPQTSFAEGKNRIAYNDLKIDLSYQIKSFTR